jgi:hypothetical protein
MRHSKLILAIGLFTAFIYLASCSKKSTPKPTTPTSPVVGYWFITSGGQFNQGFLLRADGTLKVYDFSQDPTSTDTTKAYDGIGTYSVSGNILTITDTFPNGQTFSGTDLLDLTASPPTFTDKGTSGYNGAVYSKQ